MTRNQILNEPFTASDQSFATWVASAHPGWSIWEKTTYWALDIASNAVAVNFGTQGIYKISEVSATDQYIEAKVLTWTHTFNQALQLGVRLTGSDSTATGVIVELVENNSTPFVQVIPLTNGTQGSYSFPTGFSGYVVGTDYFGVEAVGNDLKLYINGTQIPWAGGTGYLSGFSTGVPGFGTRASATQITIDDVRAGDFAVVAPVLTSATRTVTGSTTATIGATTDTGSGTLYGVVTVSGTAPSTAQILAGQDNSGTTARWSGNVSVSSTGAKTLSTTGLAAATAYYGHMYQVGPSNVISTTQFTTFATPVLSSPTGTATGVTTASGTVSSNVAAGTLYKYASTNASESAATIKASGTSQTISASGNQNVSFTGLTGTTVYYAHYVMTDGSAVDSSAVHSSSFTTNDGTVPVLTGSVTISAITQTTATITWPAGSDNVGVTGYEYSFNNSSFFDVGLVLTYGLTGLTAGTSYTCYVRAYDAAGNRSTPSISGGPFTTLEIAPTISIQPSNATVTAPATANFSATATGNNISFQWQRQPSGGGGYSNVSGGSGGTTNSYTTPATSVSGGNANNGDTYQLVVTNTGGSVTTTARTLTVNASADTTPPTLSGAVTPSSITTNSYTLTWSAASDNIVVTGYEVSIDNGFIYVDKGNVLTCNITGRSPGTTDQVKVRAYDGGGNRSISLSVSVNLLHTSVTTNIISNGSGTPLGSTLFHYSFWSAGRIGGFGSTLPIEGTTTSASDGTITIADLPIGAGLLMFAFYATSGPSNATTDKVYYQGVTIT